jgi:NADPH2:quinone reductase
MIVYRTPGERRVSGSVRGEVMAARLIAHGTVRVEAVPLREPADDEVLVKLAYAGVNPVDRYGAQGQVAADGPLPRTIGGEASGHLDGRPVLVAGAGLGSTRDGVFASAAVVPEDAVYELPADVPLDQAAALGIVGLTAWRIVELAEIGAGDRVLVLGAAGGVGQSAVSYAAAKGATVWGQTGSPAKADAITQFGAEHAVVTDAAGLSDAVGIFRPTAVFDPLGGGFTASALSVIEPRGRLVLFGASAGPQATIDLRQLYRRQLRILSYAGIIATRQEMRAALPRAIEEFAAGRLRIRVGRCLPLASVTDAFTALADRAVTGKVVLDLRTPD